MLWFWYDIILILRSLIPMKILVPVLLIGISLFLGACSNTFDGFGRDMERAGQSIQKTVD